MKYTVRKSIINIVGGIWMPYGAKAATTIECSQYDVENMRDDDGKVTRESVEQWLTTHSGDFSSVIDFSASLEDENDTVEIPWQDEENEMAFCDCMFPCEN